MKFLKFSDGFFLLSEIRGALVWEFGSVFYLRIFFRDPSEPYDIPMEDLESTRSAIEEIAKGIEELY